MDVDGNFFIVSNEFVDNFEELSGNAVKVYIYFKRLVNENKNGDEVWPSYKKIKEKTGICRRSISNAINELIENGWISEIDHSNNTVNHYHVNNASRVNNALLQKRQEQQETNSSRAKKALSLGQKSTLGVGQNMDTNNTNISILNINTNNNINNTNIGRAEMSPTPIEEIKDISLEASTEFQENFLNYVKEKIFHAVEDKKLFIKLETLEEKKRNRVYIDALAMQYTDGSFLKNPDGSRRFDVKDYSDFFFHLEDYFKIRRQDLL